MGVGAPPGLTVFNPSSDPFLVDWRSNLLVLAANKMKGSRDAITRLGDRLWEEWQEVRSVRSRCVPLSLLEQKLRGPRRSAYVATG